MATIVQEFRKGIAARRRIAGVSVPVALRQILTINNRRYGGYVVHTGIVVIIVALAISGTYRFERQVTLQSGESMLLGDYGVRFDELWAEQQDHRFVVGSTFTVFHKGNEVGTLKPSMNYYPNSQQPIGTPAVRSTLKEDLYLTLMAFDQIGGMIVALGAILAVMPQRGSGRPAVSVAEIALSEEPAEVAGEPPVVTV